jgi:shikimate dehydrogenase
MIRYGLIGYPLSHSFSKQYFANKFAQENITDTTYELFPLEAIEQLPILLRQHPHLVGLNVTIPHKQRVISFLDRLDPVAERIGAVNTIKINPNSGERVGYNSDYYGFKQSLTPWLSQRTVQSALVLGTGGASKAVVCALQDLDIDYRYVSRNRSPLAISYQVLKDEHSLADFSLIINTTPLGMSPHVDAAPDLDYDQLTAAQLCYDLVYNPEKTLFMRRAAAQRASVMNGLEMLHLQAEKSWEIWNA